MKKLLFSAITACLLSGIASAQDSFAVRAQRYVQQYYQLAIREQLRCGVPASVTLAQGILETEAGRSELACMANNHFGIKCKSDYTGEKFFHDDDAPKECFRMYRCADDSYKDHSDYLKRNPRYNPLFSLSPTDYAAWAICLKKCGYATNPQYAQRLIKLIEDFKLQQFTYSALDSAAPRTYLVNAPAASPDTAVPLVIKNETAVVKPADTVVPKPAAAAPLTTTTAAAVDTSPSKIVVDTSTTASTDIRFDSGQVLIINGLRAIMAKKGDILLQYAVKYNIHYPKLLDFNDLPDAPLAMDMPIYLEKKLSAGTHAKHTVREGETMAAIAQAEGMQLRRLMALNMLENGEEPSIGTLLELQKGTAHKPGLRPTPAPDLTTTNNNSYVRPSSGNDFVEINHNKSADTTATSPVTAPPAIAEISTSGSNIVTTGAASADTTAAVDSAKDPLTALKGELDKVVYADDNKLVPPPQAGTHQPVVITTSPDGATEPAKPAKHQKGKAPAQKGGSAMYTIKKGDTIGAIAAANGMSVNQIMRLNKIQPKSLRPGQKIRLK